LEVLEDKYNIKWWRPWESKDQPNTIGQRYGATVKKYDLINKLIKGLKEDPFGRRHIMSLWQEEDFKESDGLNPCAFLTMWNIRKTNDEYFLDMTLIQRSSDFCTAGNINGIQYCALMMMIAKTCGYKPGVFNHFLQNVQIYDRHIEQANLMLEREPFYCKPQLILNTEETDFYKFKPEDFVVIDYPIDEIKQQNPQLKFDLGI
jgi:thymidylate synthase